MHRIHKSLVPALITVLIPLFATAAGAAGEDPNPAMNDPDRFAWELFTDLNRNEGVHQTVWARWIEQNEIYGDPCKAPVWPDSPPFAPHPARFLEILNRESGSTGTFDSSDVEEVRVNRIAFDYIVENQLWYQEGVLARAAAGDVDFPTGSIIVKANWQVIDDESDAEGYYTRDYRGETVRLNAFHMIAKVLPNWFWSTWEHVDNPGRCDFIGCKDDFGSTPHYLAPHREPGREYPAGELTPEVEATFREAGLDPVWRSYRLKGTMVDFTDAAGAPNLLGNSVLEPGFESTSSCMTCHTRSTVSATTSSLSSGLSVVLSLTPIQGPVGTPDPGWFTQGHAGAPAAAAPIVYRLDFLWQLSEEPHSRQSCCPEYGGSPDNRDCGVLTELTAGSSKSGT